MNRTKESTPDRSIELSVIVVPIGDTVVPVCQTVELTQCLQGLLTQDSPPTMEIMVPVHEGVLNLDELKQQFSAVRFLPVDGLLKTGPRVFTRDHHDQLRACAVAKARGNIVACLEDHVIPAPDWARQMVLAHDGTCDVVGGAIENGVDHALNWAIFLCDLGRYQPPVSEGDSPFASVVNVSYKRCSLEAVKSVWQTSFNETAVHAKLLEVGNGIELSNGPLVSQQRKNLRVGVVLREFAVWGRSYAARRCSTVNPVRRLTYALLSPVLPMVLLMRIIRRAVSRSTKVSVLARSCPFAAVIVICAAWGELMGYWTGKPR